MVALYTQILYFQIMEAYKSLLNLISVSLKPIGFSKKGNSFYLTKEGNLGIINFQKSIDSTKTLLKFTINVGICSGKLHSLLDTGIEASKIGILQCHLNYRIGYLKSQKDEWFTLHDLTDVLELSTLLSKILIDHAVPFINNYIADSDLQKLWLQGNGAGLTPYQRYRYLTAMLKINKSEKFDAVVAEFIEYGKQKKIEHSVNIDLQQLEYL